MAQREDNIQLRNPYCSDFPTIEEQNNQDNSFFYFQGEQDYNLYEQNSRGHDFTQTNAYTTEFDQDNNQPSRAYSEVPIRPYATNSVPISGIHQKYLSERSTPLPKKSSKSQAKQFQSRKPLIKIKKVDKTLQKEGYRLNTINVNPFTQGLSALQIDSQCLHKSLRQKLNISDEQKSAIYSQLGLKQPKSLGKARSQRDMQAILTFLQAGQLPASFVHDFMLLLSNCPLVYQSLVKNLYRTINMNSSSKLTFKGIPYKYAVLKPNPKILSLLRSLRSPKDGQSFKYAVSQDFGVRKYQLSVASLEHALREAQWRHECPQSVVRCLYVELLSPGTSTQLGIDLYVEHMEVTLGELSHLLLSEAIYAIMESIKGYQALLDRYRKVSVNDECIGICSSGQFSVWINRFHEKTVSEKQGMVLPVDIIEQIVRLVKERSEPVCRTFLGKIEQYVSKHRPSWSEMLEYLKKFVLKHDVKVPQNLKYLLHQHRIKKNLSGLKSMKLSINDQQTIRETNQTNQINIVIKSPRFCPFLPSQIRTRTNSNDYQLISPNIKKNRKYSAAEPQSIKLRRTLEINQQIASQISRKPSYSDYKFSGKQSENYSSVVKTIRKLEGSKERSISSHKSKLRSKSQSSDNINIVNTLIRPRGQTTTAKVAKRHSGITEYVKYGHSHLNKSNFQSNDSNFSFEAQTVKKIGRKSSICLNSLAFKEGLYSQDASPIHQCDQNDKPCTMSPQQSLEPTFQCIPEVLGQDNIKDQIIKANNWIKTFKNLLTSDAELNISITDGQEISTYLSDVQLTRLDTLSRQMVVSLLPQGSDRELKQLRDALGK